ncbi:DUF4492 domain-containing protein [Geofilum sp. OHC36d9]|uniref:DUF4492 domain-containing protein n=1 Tax=Geofilum sp. OHC36d9 TaxID=3458413 RepID=UPI0040343B74
MGKASNVVNFYIEGFKTMPNWARTLWIIILVKLFVMFVVLKLFFFQNEMKIHYTTDEERANHVIEQITNP